MQGGSGFSWFQRSVEAQSCSKGTVIITACSVIRKHGSMDIDPEWVPLHPFV